VRQRCVLFYVQSRRLHPGLLSFPTRRSSDLKIYHHQNNPFDDYVEYAKTRSKGKTILGLILSISGKSEAQNWLGISYQQLVNAVDRKSTRLNSSHVKISYAVFCLKKKNHTLA